MYDLVLLASLEKPTIVPVDFDSSALTRVWTSCSTTWCARGRVHVGGTTYNITLKKSEAARLEKYCLMTSRKYCLMTSRDVPPDDISRSPV